MQDHGARAWFEYAVFFAENADALLELFRVAIPGFSLLLPAGIRFYTFKTMSYTIDVYRRELAPARSLMHDATPQMDRAIGPSLARLRRREPHPASPRSS